jgi:Protein of unknown function/AsmA-like C-terminal region
VSHGHRLLVWLGSIAAVLILVVVAAMWRLLQGPIELDHLIPYVEQALQRSGAGIGVAVAGISIGIDQHTHQLDLQAQNVQLSLPNGEKLANFPEMATSFSLGALLSGRIEPTRLIVEHPSLALTRGASGALTLRVGNPDATADQFGLGNALDMFAPLRPGTPWSQLRYIEIRDATVIVDDEVSGKVWRANRAVATLDRSADGAAGDLSFAVALGDNAPKLHATYRFAAPSQQLDVNLAVDRLDPAALASVSPVLAQLSQVQIPVSGSAEMRFNVATGSLEGGRLDLGFGAGQIQTDLLVSGNLPVASGELHATYAPDSAELRLDKLALDLNGGTTLAIDGKLAGVAPQLVSTGVSSASPLRGTLDVSLTHVPTARLTALWPRDVSPGGRKWVAANLSDGALDEMTVQLGVTVDPAAMTADFSGAHGTMRYHDLTVDYLNGLPPAKKVSGTATLNDRRLDFAIAGGMLKSLKATGGTMSITNIGPGTETLTVDVGVAGGLRDALDVIDSKPLGYAHDAGIDPARVGGKFDTQLHFQLPLLAALKLADVDYGAKATLSDVSYAKAAFDRPLTDGSFTLDLGHDGVHAKGAGKFDGSAATIDGNLYFHPKAGPRIVYRIGLALDDAARQRLGWDYLANRLSGPVTVEATYTVPPNSTRAEVDATLDLDAASLSCDEADWKKPAQTPGSARLVAALNNDVVVGIPQIDIKAIGLDARFAVALNPDDRLIYHVDIHRLVVGDNDISGTVGRRVGGGWQADIRASRLDLHHLLKRALEDDQPGNQTPLMINAHVAQLFLGPHREARDVSAVLFRDRGDWQSMKIDASYTNGHQLSATLGGADVNRRLHLQSDDLGATFAFFGIADNVVGGRLSIDGTVSDAGGHHLISAQIDGGDYHLVNAPVLAQLLSLTSPDAIAAMMSGSGIPFTAMRGDVSFSRGVISLRRFTAYGGALGISAHGWLNPGEGRMAVDGTIAPAYALNSVFSNFPVIGSLLMGGEGQGLIATRFQLSGSNDNPSVTVNPLSTLTPGLLRHLFDPFSNADAPDASPPAAASVPSTPAPSDASH